MPNLTEICELIFKVIGYSEKISGIVFVEMMYISAFSANITFIYASKLQFVLTRYCRKGKGPIFDITTAHSAFIVIATADVKVKFSS